MTIELKCPDCGFPLTAEQVVCPSCGKKAAHPSAVLTVMEAANFLRISRGSAYEGIRLGQIPSIRIGRRLLVPRAALEKLLEGVSQNGQSLS
jgi:excisionase family DNA binding protein